MTFRPSTEEALEVPTENTCALHDSRAWRVITPDLHHWGKVGSVDALEPCWPDLWLKICSRIYCFHYITINTILKKSKVLYISKLLLWTCSE